MGNNIGTDRIYKIKKNNNSFIGELLHKGDLNFNLNSPIETLNYFENNNIKKVYFIDNRNQPRIINVSDPKFASWSDNQFDFRPPIKLKENVSIFKNILSNGAFHSGVIQYAFTYFNMYGQESNIFYISSLFYISPNNRGASPEEIVSCSFNINLSNLDSNFDYVRIYSISRTSINGTPVLRKVADIKNNTNINFTDIGTIGEIIDTTHLLYVGGEEIIAETFTQKDNTLFLGNIKLKRPNAGTIEIPSKNNSNYKLELYKLLNNKNGTVSGDNGEFATSYIELQNKDLMIEESTGVHYSYNPDSLSTMNPSGEYESFRTLKTNEVYRLGLQFQHASGKWSESIFIADKLIDILNYTEVDPNPNISKVIYKGVKASMKLHDNNYNVISTLVANNYVKVRPVIVYPNVYERTVVAQGVVNPTLFSTFDRSAGAPNNVSSWFFRPMITEPINYITHYDLQIAANSNDESPLLNPLVYPRNYGTFNEFRHHSILPSATSRKQSHVGNELLYYVNQEIQSLYNEDIINCYCSPADKPIINRNYRDSYFIDQNLVTFHSPDVEFDESLINIYNEELTCKIVGYVNLTGFISKKYINIDGGTWGTYSQGIIQSNIGQTNYNSHGAKELISFPLYRDICAYEEGSSHTQSNPGNYADYVIYPWHSMDSSLIWHPDAQSRAKLEYNKTANLRYSTFNSYLNNSAISYDITPVQLFNSNQTDIVKIKYKDDRIGLISYQGNVDKLVNQNKFPEGYPIICNEIGSHKISTGNIYIDNHYTQVKSGNSTTKAKFKNTPVQVRFNSTPHLVFGLETLESTDSNTIIQPILPSIRVPGNSPNTYTSLNNQNLENGNVFWNDYHYQIKQDEIDIPFNYGGLWLVELQRDINNINSRFNDGPNGPTPDTLENLKWMPCGNAIDLTNDNNQPLSYVDIEWTDGDTYLQRYDCLKTYGTEADKQAVTEILSFVCETRVNLDGRYDRNRGVRDNTAMNPTKFNLINQVYNQSDNYFTYRALNYDKFNLDSFPNTITWTKSKMSGETVDPWTNINMLSTLDVNGSLGNITALKTYNSNIIGFQNNGIFTVNFNNRVQVPVSDGVPIELSNNFKVDGYRYISSNVGVSNKWAINNDSSRGLYFIDDLSKSLFLFSEGLNNLSDNLGFHSWFTKHIKTDGSWNPGNLNNFTLQHDKIHDYLYITNKDYSLGYSELLNNFGSFFSYENIPYMFNVWDKFISLQPTTVGIGEQERPIVKLWANYEGDYNKFYGENKPYHITYAINPEFNTDKIFEILEYRADAFNNDGTLEPNPLFNKLDVWNEYQSSTAILLDSNTHLPTNNLRGRFRMWRVNIPRVTNILNNPAVNNLRPHIPDRMRGTNMFLKLESDGVVNKKNILHDIIVYTR